MLLGLALATTATASYAWFDIVTSASIDQLHITFGNGSTLQLGVKGDDGKIVYGSDWTDATLSKQNSSYVPFDGLEEVSSMFSSTWIDSVDKDTGYPILYEPFYASMSPTSTPQAKSGYLQFELYFLSDRNMYVFLDGSSSIKALESANESRANQAQSEGNSSVTKEKLNEVTKVTRVSFLSNTGYTILSPDKEGTTKYGGILDVNGDGYYDYRSGKETLYGEYSGTPIYKDASSSDSPTPDNPNAFLAKHKAGIEELDMEESIDKGLMVAEEKSYTIEELSLDKSASYYDSATMVPIAHCLANVPTRVVFTLYAEGWDTHLTESVAYGAFSLKLAFTGLESAK